MPVPAKRTFFISIGPPLVDSFLTLPGLPEAMALEATALYRKRYTAIGIFENELYPGITDLLEALDEAGSCLLRHRPNRKFLCATLPIILALRLIFGKLAVLPSMLPANQKCSHRRGPEPAWLQKTKERVLMVGDTAYDVEGARKIGIDCVGVTYGYGKETELAAAHPLGLAATVEALKDGLLTHAFG